MKMMIKWKKNKEFLRSRYMPRIIIEKEHADRRTGRIDTTILTWNDGLQFGKIKNGM